MDNPRLGPQNSRLCAVLPGAEGQEASPEHVKGALHRRASGAGGGGVAANRSG